MLQKYEFITLEERRKAYCVKLVSDMAQEEHKLNHLLPPLRSEISVRTPDRTKTVFITILVELIDLKIVHFHMLLIFLTIHRVIKSFDFYII